MTLEDTKTHTDIKPDNWLERFCPKILRPYAYLARLDRPVGIWLLLIPGWLALDLAKFTEGGHASNIFWLFLLGAILMRSAGCVVNDLWDIELDKKVARTRVRPLAAGEVSPFQAIVFLGILLSGGLAVLLQMNALTIILGLISVPLIISYPLMKRITWWPQAFLGITFNFGALMGWSAITGTLSFPAVLLYVSCILWTLGYDTVYAHQDIEDDMRAGIKSTAIKLKGRSKIWVSGFFAASWILLLLAAVMATQSEYMAIALIPAGMHLINQVDKWDATSPQSSLKIFKSSVNYGWMAMLGVFIHNIFIYLI